MSNLFLKLCTYKTASKPYLSNWITSLHYNTIQYSLHIFDNTNHFYGAGIQSLRSLRLRLRFHFCSNGTFLECWNNNWKTYTQHGKMHLNKNIKATNIKVKVSRGQKCLFKGFKGCSSKLKAFKGFKGSLGGLLLHRSVHTATFTLLGQNCVDCGSCNPAWRISGDGLRWTYKYVDTIRCEDHLHLWNSGRICRYLDRKTLLMLIHALAHHLQAGFHEPLTSWALEWATDSRSCSWCRSECCCSSGVGDQKVYVTTSWRCWCFFELHWLPVHACIDHS